MNKLKGTLIDLGLNIKLILDKLKYKDPDVQFLKDNRKIFEKIISIDINDAATDIASCSDCVHFKESPLGTKKCKHNKYAEEFGFICDKYESDTRKTET